MKTDESLQLQLRPDKKSHIQTFQAQLEHFSGTLIILYYLLKMRQTKANPLLSLAILSVLF